jgi:predicted porin
MSPGVGFSIISSTLSLSLVAMPMLGHASPDVAELQRIIAQQQRQLEAQQQQLDAQRQMLEQIQAQTQALAESAGQEVDQLERTVEDQQQQLTSLQRQVSQPRTARVPPSQPMTLKPSAAGAGTTAQAPTERAVVSGGPERVKLAISGHVNRMVNIADDGGGTQTYFVDNDNSESQVRFVGTVAPNDDLTLGGTIELSIAPNKSGNIDQLNQEENNIFDQRKAEVTLASKRFGKLWFGKGDTGSYTAGARDLSGTGVIAYSTIVDTAGGLFFREKQTGELTDIKILNAFSSFDGLSRRDRIRYDTPTFAGFQARVTAASKNRYDGSLWWAGQGYGFKAAAAGAVSDPNEDDARLQYNGSMSVLHEATGLNVTLSSGLLERKDQGNQQNLYAKLGWRHSFFSFGETAFGIDYTQSRRLPEHHDKSYSYGAAAVQQFDDYGVELFALYRLHDLDRRDEPKVDDIGVVSIGTRVKF